MCTSGDRRIIIHALTDDAFVAASLRILLSKAPKSFPTGLRNSHVEFIHSSVKDPSAPTSSYMGSSSYLKPSKSPQIVARGNEVPLSTILDALAIAGNFYVFFFFSLLIKKRWKRTIRNKTNVINEM